MVFALRTGRRARAGWVSYERERWSARTRTWNTIGETASPTGMPRHAYETPVFRVRGVPELHWDSWPRIDDAIASYRISAAPGRGRDPSRLRFQVGLPFPSSALNGFKADFAADYPVAERAFEDLVARELQRLTAEIPPSDLAIQWDSAYEVQDIEGVLAWTADGAWERFAGPVSRLTPADPRRRPGRIPPLLRHVSRVADVRGPRSGRARADGQPCGRELRSRRRLAAPRRPPLPAQRGRPLLRPLRSSQPGDARVFLGIVLPLDGIPGSEAAASARHPGT